MTMKITIQYLKEDEGLKELEFLEKHFDEELASILLTSPSNYDLSTKTINFEVYEREYQNLIKTKYPELIL